MIRFIQEDREINSGCDTSRQPDELEKGQEVKGKTTYSFDTRIPILVFI